MCPSTFHTVQRPRAIPLRCPQCQARQLPSVLLARSSLHRYGIFVSGTVNPGEMILGCAGEWIPRADNGGDEELLRHPDDDAKVWRSFQPDWLAFINHSDTPNCVAVVGVDDVPSLRVGPRRISPWSELTIDYGPAYEWEG